MYMKGEEIWEVVYMTDSKTSLSPARGTGSQSLRGSPSHPPPPSFRSGRSGAEQWPPPARAGRAAPPGPVWSASTGSLHVGRWSGLIHTPLRERDGESRETEREKMKCHFAI